MNRNDIYCPITQTNNVNVISKIDTKYIIEKWQNQYSIDVSSEFTGVENIYYCHSTVADFYFFYPFVTGSSKFYQLLQEKYFKKDASILLIHSGGLQGNRSVKPGVLLY